MIIHTSGEKTVPTPMEDIIISNHAYVFFCNWTRKYVIYCLCSVIGVVMFGRDHDQPGVLVELKHAIDVTNEQEVINAKDFVWLASHLILADSVVLNFSVS